MKRSRKFRACPKELRPLSQLAAMHRESRLLVDGEIRLCYSEGFVSVSKSSSSFLHRPSKNAAVLTPSDLRFKLFSRSFAGGDPGHMGLDHYTTHDTMTYHKMPVFFLFFLVSVKWGGDHSSLISSTMTPENKSTFPYV